MQVNLTERQQHILWATIRHYIATAEPVGSKALVQEYDLKVSPATIRNGMGILEKAGLLYQPHTSAGRVPSDSGYRVYVDRMITPSDPLAQEVAQLLREQLNTKNLSIEAILRGAAQILSTLSGYITLITMPQTPTDYLRHLQLISIDAGKVMLIVVTNSYQTQSIVMELADECQQANSTTSTLPLAQEEELLEQELQILSNFLNTQLRGQPLVELSTLDWSELDQTFERYTHFIRGLLQDLSRRTQTPESTRIQFSGVSEVLRLPEFSQLQQVQTIIHLLEDEPEQLWPLICQMPEPEQRVSIRIGSENPLEPIQGCSLISAQYYQGSQPAGSVGMLGPTRMVYENVIALVEATADYISETITTN